MTIKSLGSSALERLRALEAPRPRDRWACSGLTLVLALSMTSVCLGQEAPSPQPQTSESTPQLCSDGADNDGDGFADCRDQDCWSLPTCSSQRQQANLLLPPSRIEGVGMIIGGSVVLGLGGLMVLAGTILVAFWSYSDAWGTHEIEENRTLSFVFWGVGSALLITGGVLLGVGRRRRRAARARASRSPLLAPSLTPLEGGGVLLGLSGAFSG